MKRHKPAILAMLVLGMVFVAVWIAIALKSEPEAPAVAAEARQEPDVTPSMKETRAPRVPKANQKPATGNAATPSESPSTDQLAAVVATTATSSSAVFADIVAVKVSETGGAFEFSVTVASQDLGCDQYANWWEVVNAQGELVYRRVLAHSHVGEQPFTRSGGPVKVGMDTPLWVRAHMHPFGYGGRVMTGTVRTGFRAETPKAGFARDLSKKPPLAGSCAF